MNAADIRSPEVCAVVGVTHRQLDYWSRTNLVTAARETKGSGFPRFYSVDDVVRMAIVKRLLDAGVSLQRIRKVSDALSAEIAREGHVTIVLAPDDVVVATSGDHVVDIVRNTSGVLQIVPVGSVRAEMEERLARLREQRHQLVGS